MLGTLAFAVVLQITRPPGPGLSPDSVAYVGNAESLVARHEFRTPTAPWWSPDSTHALAHFPPGFSILIAIPTALGMPPVQAARLVNALAAFATMTTLVLLVTDASAVLVAILTGAALFAMSAMLDVHMAVLSEPVFLALTALLLATMLRRPTDALTMGVFAALGTLVRYAGVSLIGAAVVWSVAQHGPIALRLRRALLALVPAVVLQGAWVLRSRQIRSTESIRRFALYGNLRPTLTQGFGTIKAWLVPVPDAWLDRVPHRGALTLIALIVLALLAVAGVRAMRERIGSAQEAKPDSLFAMRLCRACALLIACYVGVIVASRISADPDIPFDQRILSPALLLATVCMAVCIYHWWRGTRAILPRLAVMGALLGWCFSAGRVTWAQQRRIHELGSHFDRPQWSRNDLMDYARAEGASHPLFTNRPGAVYFHLHRPTHGVPLPSEAGRMEEFADSVRVRDGRVLMFGESGRTYMPLDSLRGVPGLRIVLEAPAGAVFAPAPRRPRPAPLPRAAPTSPPH